LTASASIKNPQSFNRYTYALNSPYKFTDPLGLLSEYTSGACGSRCKNSYTGENSGPMTSGGTESPFEKEFAAMQESRAVDDAAALAATVVHEALHGSLIAPAASALIQDSEVSDPNNLCNPHLAFESSFLPAESNPATVMSSVPLHRLPKFIAALNKIWAQSGYGTRDFEASFNVNGDPTNPQIVINPFTNETGSQTLKIIIDGPNKTYAIVHVHSNRISGEPSTPDNNSLRNGKGDTGLADQYGINVYVLHRTGLRVYDPVTKKTTLLSRNVDSLRGGEKR